MGLGCRGRESLESPLTPSRRPLLGPPWVELVTLVSLWTVSTKREEGPFEFPSFWFRSRASVIQEWSPTVTWDVHAPWMGKRSWSEQIGREVGPTSSRYVFRVQSLSR